MGKITMYLMLLSVVILLYHFAGLIEGTPSSLILNLALNPDNLANSSLATLITSALAIVAGVAVVAGFFINVGTEAAIKAGLATFLVSIGWDLLIIFQRVSEMSVMVATLIVSPLIIVYLFSVIEWLTGKD